MQTAYADARDKLRKKASRYYSAGNYTEAKILLTDLIKEDISGRFWMDYAMLSNIYLREGKSDSAKNIIAVGKSISEKAEDPRVRRRNNVAWDNLLKQLKHKTDILIFPKFERLELYADEQMDSLQQIEEIDKKIEELLFASTLETPVIAPKSTSDDVLKSGVIAGATPLEVKGQSAQIAGESVIVPSLYPRLAGGIQSVNEYISNNLLYPDTASAAEIAYGAAVAKINVDANGIATDIDIIRVKPDSVGFSELAIEVFKNMKYIPAESEGRKIPAELQVPVLFKAPSNSKEATEN